MTSDDSDPLMRTCHGIPIYPEDLNAVPIAELEALADRWEEFAEPAGWDGYSDGVRDATESCAQDLREVIEDYE
jgi:hypothetical protein